jgi:putative PEP-CTERM system histidine kinase
VNPDSQTFSLVASTTLNQKSGSLLTPAGQDAGEIIQALRANPEPVDLDSSREHWASALRRCNPGEFRKGGNRVCVPMLARGELIGFMTLGDRVGAVAFSLQDFDVLKCVADQAAASMLNISLSQQLLRAKELEAFQTMSAFFVHDLKNTASTLSLMLQNLPIHFDNPAFREDALRAVGKTVNHINSLISRLSMLRQNTSLKPVASDLNQLVQEALKCLDEAKGLQVVRDLGELPGIMLDPDQISKLIVNLALNAREAVGAGGRIEVRTRADSSWVVLSIADNGCGMPAEFISRSLFRPFQTTKKQGIGIGMFQCKMIVEAHRGRIEVESAQGKGTTFRVLLPVQNIAK